MKTLDSDMQDNNEADDKFKELADSMLNFEAEPPAGMWERIEGGLLKRRRRMMIFRYSSIAASLILLLGLGITYFTTDIFRSSSNRMISEIAYPPADAAAQTDGADKNRNVPSVIVVDPSKQKDTPQDQNLEKGVKLKVPVNKSNPSNVPTIKSNPSNVPTIKSNPSNVPTIKSDPSNKSRSKRRASGKVDPLKKLRDSYSQFADGSGVNQIKIRERLNPPVPMLEGMELAVISHLNPYPGYPEEEEVKPGEYANDWSLAMGYGITSGADYTNDNEMLYSGGDRYSHDDFSADLANETSYFEEIDNTVHDAPLSLGIIVDKRLSRRLSFETGVTYTLLSFRVKTDELSPYYKKYRNELNYLGLPAGIRYRFLDRKKFNLYALQWVVLEKGIGGKWYVDTYTNDVITESESKQQNIRGFQLSSVTGLGAEVKLGGKFYLFAQGGVQAFFMNKTQPYNIRSTQVAWPSLQTGLRINLH